MMMQTTCTYLLTLRIEGEVGENASSSDRPSEDDDKDRGDFNGIDRTPLSKDGTSSIHNLLYKNIVYYFTLDKRFS